MVPEGWQDLRLDEICSKKIVYGIVQAGEHVETGVPYIKSSDVGREINTAGLSKTSPEIHRKFGRSSVHPGDIVFSLRGNTGSTSIVPDDLPEANLTQGTARLTVSENYDRRFVRFMLGSNSIMRQVLAVAKGSTFTEVSLDALRKITLAAPPLTEQQKIAEILSTWDKAIETTEALLANARTQKRALMQSLLTGTRRFPGFEDHPWREVRLGDVASLVTKGTTPTSVGFEFTDHGVSFVKAENIDGSGTVAQSRVYVSQECHDALRRSQLESGDILVTIAGAIGRVGLVSREILPANTNQAVAIIRVPENAEISRCFVSFWLRGPFIQSILRGTAAGGAQPNVNLAQLSNLPMKCPVSSEQELIVAAINDASLKVDQCMQQLNHLRTEKKSLMQQLLTGKRRVNVEVSDEV